MIGLVITSISGVFIVVMGIVLLTGRGSFLIAGYNTKSRSEKAKYDAKALCKFTGKIVIPIGVLTFFIGIESIVHWFVWVYLAVVSVLVIFAVVYANTGNKFRK